MRLVVIVKFLLIAVLPFIIFLCAAHLSIFDLSFYNREFLQYGVQNEVQDVFSINEKVIKYIGGKSSELPAVFNGRETQHLYEVREIIKKSRLSLYLIIVSFTALLAYSSFLLKGNGSFIDYTGNMLVYGGLFTLFFSAAIFLLIISNFSGFFDAFHESLFRKGTYLFDPSREIIVRIYPEQLFEDMGNKISATAVEISLMSYIAGMLLLNRQRIHGIIRRLSS